MTNQGQKIYQSRIGLNKLFLLVKIDSISIPNKNHYELLCRDNYKTLSVKSIGTTLSNDIDNYDIFRLIKNCLIKTSRLSKPEYGIYAYINKQINVDNLCDNDVIRYIKSIENGKFYNNNLTNLTSKDYGNISDMFINFENTDITTITA